MSILSERQDAYGFHYGFLEGDHRQINVRQERCYYPPDEWGTLAVRWFAYVGGTKIPDSWETKAEVENAAISWAKANPEKGDEG